MLVWLSKYSSLFYEDGTLTLSCCYASFCRRRACLVVVLYVCQQALLPTRTFCGSWNVVSGALQVGLTEP